MGEEDARREEEEVVRHDEDEWKGRRRGCCLDYCEGDEEVEAEEEEERDEESHVEVEEDSADLVAEVCPEMIENVQRPLPKNGRNPKRDHKWTEKANGSLM